MLLIIWGLHCNVQHNYSTDHRPDSNVKHTVSTIRGLTVQHTLCTICFTNTILQYSICFTNARLQTHVYKRMPRMHVKFGLLNQTCPFWTHLLTLKTFGLSGEASKAKNLPITWTLSEIHFRSTLDHAGLGFDWCCVYSIIRNSLEAWLKTLFTRILLGGRSRCI